MQNRLQQTVFLNAPESERITQDHLDSTQSEIPTQLTIIIIIIINNNRPPHSASCKHANFYTCGVHISKCSVGFDVSVYRIQSLPVLLHPSSSPKS